MSELTERLRKYSGAGYLERQGNKPWLHQAALDCTEAAAEIERLTAAMREAQNACIAETCRADAAEAKVKELEKDLDQMIWLRRRSDERAFAAETRVGELTAALARYEEIYGPLPAVFKGGE